jgi:hypothetical protein
MTSGDQIIAIVADMLAGQPPMILRQIFYRLVVAQTIENTNVAYDRLSKRLIVARQQGIIPWEQIEDRLRAPRAPAMWGSVAEFGAEVRDWYRRDVWETQPRYLELWVEKDALSGIFERALEPYGVAVNVARGYDSWSAIKNAADRLLRYEDRDPLIFYFGDFDPSGEHMVVSLRERLGWFAAQPEWEGLRFTNPTKVTDTRAAKHIARHGDVSVELDALPPEVLRQRIVACVERTMDLRALARLERRERAERKIIASKLS